MFLRDVEPDGTLLVELAKSWGRPDTVKTGKSFIILCYVRDYAAEWSLKVLIFYNEWGSGTLSDNTRGMWDGQIVRQIAETENYYSYSMG